MKEVATETVNVITERIFGEESAVVTEKLNGGVLAMPFEDEKTWMQIYIQEDRQNHDNILVTMDSDNAQKSLFERILNSDSLDENSWSLPKDWLMELSKDDPQAIFKITEILEMFCNEIPSENALMNVINVLQSSYTLDYIFNVISAFSREDASVLFAQEAEGNIIEVFIGLK